MQNYWITDARGNSLICQHTLHPVFCISLLLRKTVNGWTAMAGIPAQANATPFFLFSYLVGAYRQALLDAIPHVDTLTNGGVWEECSRARRRSEWCSFGESHDRERVHSGNLHAQGWLGGSNSCLKINKKKLHKTLCMLVLYGYETFTPFDVSMIQFAILYFFSACWLHNMILVENIFQILISNNTKLIIFIFIAKI